MSHSGRLRLVAAQSQNIGAPPQVTGRNRLEEEATYRENLVLLLAVYVLF